MSETVLELDGRLESSTAPLFQHQLSEASPSGQERLLLDLSRVTFIGSAALRAILVTASALLRRGENWRSVRHRRSHGYLWFLDWMLYCRCIPTLHRRGKRWTTDPPRIQHRHLAAGLEDRARILLNARPKANCFASPIYTTREDRNMILTKWGTA